MKISKKSIKAEINNQKTLMGFTLMEFLVVIFIIGLISSVVLVNFNAARKRYAVSQAAQKLAADLRRAQNIAISGKQASVAHLDKYGAGIYVRKGNTKYTIFIDLNNNYTYQPANDDSSLGILNLPSGITIQAIDPGYYCTGINCNVYFMPPRPITYFGGVQPGSGDSMGFILTNGTFSKTITIYGSGKIDIN